MPSNGPLPRCPCGSGRPFPACCGPLHQGFGQASTAEQLMRSRFSAYAAEDADYLLRTWHPSTRPRKLTFQAGLSWDRLEIVEVVDGGEDDQTGVVAFRAAYTSSGQPGVQAERSQFVRRGRRWTYLDGEPLV